MYDYQLLSILRLRGKYAHIWDMLWLLVDAVNPFLTSALRKYAGPKYRSSNLPPYDVYLMPVHIACRTGQQ